MGTILGYLSARHNTPAVGISQGYPSAVTLAMVRGARVTQACQEILAALPATCTVSRARCQDILGQAEEILEMDINRKDILVGDLEEVALVEGVGSMGPGCTWAGLRLGPGPEKHYQC